MSAEISLYECSNARVNRKKIFCAKGHSFEKRTVDGMISLNRLIRGNALVFSICQNCSDFDRNGDPIPAGERGWIGTLTTE